MLLYTFYPTIEKCYENVMCLLGLLYHYIKDLQNNDSDTYFFFFLFFFYFIFLPIK